MRLRFDNDRVLAVVAHPDDAELLCAGTLARARRDGAEIAVCVMCRGDKGQPSRQIANLATRRRREAAAASRLLNARLFWCGFADGTLTDDDRTRKKLIDVYRTFRPSLVLAHAPEDYHTDHRAASALAEAASWLAASRGQKTRWPPVDEPPALWWMDTVQMQSFEPGFYIDVSDFADLKEAMIRCHTSQLQRGEDADFAPLVDLLQVQMVARGSQCGVKAAEAFRCHRAFKRLAAW